MSAPTNPPDPARQSAEERATPDCPICHAPMPKWIRLPKDVHGDWPFSMTVARSGVYAPHYNPQGAISVNAENGKSLGVKPDEWERVPEDSAAIRSAHTSGRLAGLEEAARVARAEAERNERLAETARKNGKDAGRFQTRAEACFAIAAGIRALARSAPPPNSDRLTALNEAADMIIRAAGRDPIPEAFAADMAMALRSTPPPPCTCGSGGHPRKCAAHPGAYAEHVATLDAENRAADAREDAAKPIHEIARDISASVPPEAWDALEREKRREEPAAAFAETPRNWNECYDILVSHRHETGEQFAKSVLRWARERVAGRGEGA